MKVLKIGHRGAAGHVPENTLSSFKKALELKVDMIELDVHVCKSGELVVIHDEKVNRTTNGKGLVAEKTLQELNKLWIKKTEKIPTLSQVLNLIERRCRVNIELKGENTAKPVNNIIKKYIKNKKWSYKDFLVSSFNHSMLEEIKKTNPQIKIGLLIEKIPKDIIETATRLKAYSINISQKYTKKELIEKAHKRKLKVFVYTVDKPKRIEKMKELGVDGIISDYPDRI